MNAKPGLTTRAKKSFSSLPSLGSLIDSHNYLKKITAAPVAANGQRSSSEAWRFITSESVRMVDNATEAPPKIPARSALTKFVICGESRLKS